MANHKQHSGWHKWLHSIWVFPSIVTLALIVMTMLGINGSSIGVYDTLLQSESNHVLAGHPRTVRSDEWLVNTAMTFAQKVSNFPVVNTDLGDGQDMAVAMDVPYREWSVIFKPQNLVFFVLPLSAAFAFKWWFMSYVLLLGVYFFFVKLTGKKLPAALLAIFLAASPFVQWWYQSITLLSIGYAFILATLAMQIIDTADRKKRLIYSGLLFYILACFALLMYPAFQVPCALFIVAVVAGYYTSKHSFKELFSDWLWAYFVIPVMLAVSVLGAFLASHWDAIKTISSTVYPGSRYVPSGGAGIPEYILWPFSYILRDDTIGTGLDTNQSEASNFMFFGLLALPFLVYIYLKYRTNKSAKTKVNFYVLIASVLLLIFIALRIFVPHTDLLFNIAGLSSVPHERLKIVMGMINVLVLGLMVCWPLKYKIKEWLVYSTFLAVGSIAALVLALQSFDILLLGKKEIALLIVACISIAVLIIAPWYKARLTGLILATGFAIFSTWLINPLYKGTGAATEGSLVNAIAKIERKDDKKWIVDNYFPVENLPIMAGAEAIGGTYTYPQLDTWLKYFPKDEKIINRYAHINFILNEDTVEDTLDLVQADHFNVKTRSCSPFLQAMNVDYIVSSQLVDRYKCFSPSPETPRNSPFVIYVRD